MLALPDGIRYGYKLAKMMRNKYVMAPIGGKLLALGVVTNLEDLITSYMLKNCVMFLTQDLQQTDDVCASHYVTWAIQIYRQLETLQCCHGTFRN